MKYTSALLALTFATCSFLAVNSAPAQGTAFTYQGRLANGTNVVNGRYDLNFSLFSVVSGPGQISSTLTNNATAVSNGLFVVSLDFGPQFFGLDRWLEIAVRTNGVGTFTNLAPRQKITPAPYAIYSSSAASAASANSVSAANISGTIQLNQLPNTILTNNATGVILNGSFTGNGAGLTALNASQLTGGTVPVAVLSNAWRIGGNASTTPGTHFLGTTDNQPLEIKVNGTRALRLEPTGSSDTVNVIGGSARNFVGAGVVGATIGGGGAGDWFGVAFTNRVEADFGTVSGGAQNMILNNAVSATIGGGVNNTVETNSLYSTIGGGVQNMILADTDFGTIGGGAFNTIESFCDDATIGGGYQNIVEAYATASTIAGGQQNTIKNSALFTTIGGGAFNTIIESSYYATIGGGLQNTIQLNSAYATVPGGLANSAASYAFAAGRRAKANHTGAFVWADSTDTDFASTAANQFAIRASGGVMLSDSTPSLSFGTTVRQMLNLWGTQYGIGVQSSTVYFRTDNASGKENGFAWYKGGIHNDAAQNAGGGTTMMTLDGNGLTVNGTFISSSDRNVKQDFAEVNSQAVLEKVAQLPIQTWTYKNDPTTKHLGPVAQDFYAAFNIGMDDKHISMVDADGVALAAIQGLNQKVDEKEARVTALEKQVAELKQLVEKLSLKGN